MKKTGSIGELSPGFMNIPGVLCLISTSVYMYKLDWSQ